MTHEQRLVWVQMLKISLNLSFEFTKITLRLTIVGAKRNFEKRRNFKFSKENGFDSIHTHSHFTRIILVKTPRYRNGEVIGYDLYDLYQCECH